VNLTPKTSPETRAWGPTFREVCGTPAEGPQAGTAADARPLQRFCVYPTLPGGVVQEALWRRCDAGAAGSDAWFVGGVVDSAGCRSSAGGACRWLPYDTEALWATPLTSDTARIDNVPFLADGVAQGDIVRFVTDADDCSWGTERVAWSGSNTIRILPVPSGPLGPSAHGYVTEFRRHISTTPGTGMRSSSC
jgi:hypothetical protein